MTAKKRARKNTSGRTKGRDMPLREDGQVYARVTHMLGNGRLTAACDDGQSRLCKIRGSMRKREWVRVGDTVLVCLRTFQDEKADVVHRYDDGEVTRLSKLGEIQGLKNAHATDEDVEGHDAFEFEAADDELDDWERI
jgi:translation initiation factor 1A